jgi:hypothetical protein
VVLQRTQADGRLDGDPPTRLRAIDQRSGVVLGLTSGRWSVTTGLW